MAGARQRTDPRVITTALLGGSFNPAHGGHRRITRFALDALGLDEAWWLVSPGNPLKPKKGMAPLAARVSSGVEQARRAPIRVCLFVSVPRPGLWASLRSLRPGT